MSKRANLVLVIAGLAATFAILSRRTLSAEGALAVDQVRALAEGAVASWGFTVDPAMIVRIAWIESGFNPSAVRYEPGIGDVSSGLMQTLVGTARWLASDMGYTAYGVPTMDELLRSPQASIYFGAAYLDYLSRYRGSARGEEWIVRSYNGGPGHGQASTDNYWRKYLAAKERFG